MSEFQGSGICPTIKSIRSDTADMYYNDEKDFEIWASSRWLSRIGREISLKHTISKIFQKIYRKKYYSDDPKYRTSNGELFVSQVLVGFSNLLH